MVVIMSSTLLGKVLPLLIFSFCVTGEVDVNNSVRSFLRHRSGSLVGITSVAEDIHSGFTPTMRNNDKEI